MLSELDNLPEDIRTALEECKEFQRARPDAPTDTPAIVVEACGEVCVCMPPTFESATRLQKLLGSAMNDKREIQKYLETYVAETIFWMRGQTGKGRKAATEHARKVAQSHYSKYELLTKIANEVQEQLSAGEAIPSSKKY